MDYSRAKTLHPTLDPPPHPSIKGCKAVAHELYLYTKIGLQRSRCSEIGSPEG